MRKKPIMGISSVVVLLLSLNAAWLSVDWGDGSVAVAVDAVSSGMRAILIALGGSVAALVLAIGSLIRGEMRPFGLIALVFGILAGCVVVVSFAAM